jgi:hypothetical protein
MKRGVLSALALATALAATPSQGQEVSDSVKRTCRSVADQTARTIVYAQRARLDPAAQVKKVADSWLEGVQAHMLLTASRVDYLSEQELASIGYSYCVERRPTDRR